MSTPLTSHAPNASTPAQQASLRDYLNTRLAPFIKRAITQSLRDEPEYPLRYVGEYLIQQSLRYEKDPQKPEIREMFQYNFDKRPEPLSQVGTQEQQQQQGQIPQQQAAIQIQSEALAGGVDSNMGDIEGRQQPGDTTNRGLTDGEALSISGTSGQTGTEESMAAEQSQVRAQQDTDMGDAS